MDGFGYDSVEDFIIDELNGSLKTAEMMEEFLKRFKDKCRGFIYDRDSSGTDETDIKEFDSFIALSGGERSTLVFMYKK